MSQTKFITLKLSPEKLSKFIDQEVKTETPTTTKTPISKPKSSPKKQESSPSISDKSTPSSAKTDVADVTSTSNQDDEKKSLDKTGSGVRRWAKKPLMLQSFTGYQLTFKSWNGGPKARNNAEGDESNEGSEQGIESVKGTPASTPVQNIKTVSGLKIQIKLNNKKIELNKNKLEKEGSIEMDDVADGNSNFVSSVDVSRATTPGA